MGDKPAWRLIRKAADGKKWETIGAAWNRDAGGYSVNIELVRGGEKIKCLLVPNEKPKEQTPNIATQAIGSIADDDAIPF